MIRGDALGGALRALLPSDYGALRCSKCGGSDIRHHCSYCGDSTYDHECNDGCRACGGAPIRVLDPADRHVQHAIADGLRSLGHEVGPLLPLALGGRIGDGVEETACPGPDDALSPTCDRCKGTGKIRRPVPAARVSARLLAASVEGVDQGRGVVRGVLGEWREVAPDVWERDSLDGMPTADAFASRSSGWAIRATNIYARADLGTRGPETGPAGRAAADAALLWLGFAYLDPAARDGVRVPGEVPGE